MGVFLCMLFCQLAHNSNRCCSASSWVSVYLILIYESLVYILDDSKDTFWYTSNKWNEFGEGLAPLTSDRAFVVFGQDVMLTCLLGSTGSQVRNLCWAYHTTLLLSMWTNSEVTRKLNVSSKYFYVHILVTVSPYCLRFTFTHATNKSQERSKIGKTVYFQEKKHFATPNNRLQEYMFNQRFVLSEKICVTNNKCLIYYVSKSTTSITTHQSPVLIKKATSYVHLLSDWTEMKPKLKLRDISTQVKKRYDALELSVRPFPIIFNIKSQPALHPKETPPVKKWRFVLPGEFLFAFQLSSDLGINVYHIQSKNIVLRDYSRAKERTQIMLMEWCNNETTSVIWI